MATLKSNPDRLREVNRDVEELGAKVLHQWATLGEFDFVNVVEAPDTATIARVSVALGARGSTKIQTLPALTIDEFVADAQLAAVHGATSGARPVYVSVTLVTMCDGPARSAPEEPRLSFGARCSCESRQCVRGQPLRWAPPRRRRRRRRGAR